MDGTQIGLTVTNWVQIISVIVLGTTAILAPWVSEIIKRRWFKPELTIEFVEEPPFCHKTTWGRQFDVYYFRFKVLNNGKSNARLCEALIDELYSYDKEKGFIKEKNFGQVNLNWSSRPNDFFLKQYININPGIGAFCDLGHLSEMRFQTQQNTPDWQASWPEDVNNNKFVLEVSQIPFSQKTYLLEGKYRVRVVIHAENASKVFSYFEIQWSGKWKNSEKEQFEELIIRKI